jgi:DNA repair protein RadA/Sms
MAKVKVQYGCTACGYVAAKWLGRCPDCGEWNTLIEQRQEAEGARSIRRAAAGPGEARPVPITHLGDVGEQARLASGIGEFDRILGGGLVPGSVSLIGGPPGVGKSTLLMQVALGLAHAGLRVHYASGEESVEQVRDRAKRLGALSDRLYLQAETDLDRILDGADQVDPAVLIIDSVQTVYSPGLGGTPGNISQVREVAARATLHAKSKGRVALLVGHVTKDGTLAGPRTLEHVVDTVVYFEGDATPPYRVLRAQKNRFGATGELGLFEMTGAGLREVAEPSQALLADRPTDRPGTAVTACLEGSRPLLLEVQALVAPGYPGSTRRTALGIDGARLAMLVAVLGKADWVLHDKDVYMNVAGGVRITEPAADLAVCAAVLSSLFGRALGSDWLVLGEVGLTGEVRGVNRLDLRLEEARRHGFKRVLMPQAPAAFRGPDGIEVVGVRSLEDAMRELF